MFAVNSFVCGTLNKDGGGCLLEGGVFSGTYGIAHTKCNSLLSAFLPQVLVSFIQRYKHVCLTMLNNSKYGK